MLAGCTGYPRSVTPVEGFELDRYLGRWYEIARLDHSFERGLSNVTAEYQLREDGGVRVINRGYSNEQDTWKEAEGRAYFVGDSHRGHLKVSFFGPFYGSYVVFELDQENYQYAFVSGPDTDYLWLLARRPVIEEGLLGHFRETARRRGFDADSLIVVEHDLQ
jgi:apolipoprotein D and lipocalin family protein